MLRRMRSNYQFSFSEIFYVDFQRESLPPDVPAVPDQHPGRTDSGDLESGDNGSVQHHSSRPY